MLLAQKSKFGTAKTISPIVMQLLSPARRFRRVQYLSAIILIIAVLAALLWSNSPWASAYFSLWQTPVSVGFGSSQFNKPLLLWINDALIALFFFVIGLELKRELLAGELSNSRKALVPLIAAMGGIAAPAFVYLAVVVYSGGGEALRGWAIPAATDTAFAIGLLAAFRDRVPLSAKVFLTTFAIADDVAATLIIAFFYSGALNYPSLVTVCGLLAAMMFCNLLGFRNISVYAVLSLLVWGAVLESGIHPTIAGLLCAFFIPAFRRLEPTVFVERAREVLNGFESSLGDYEPRSHSTQAQQAQFSTLEKMAVEVQTPLQRLENGLHPWVAYIIVPIFIFANAGVALQSQDHSLLELAIHPVSVAVIAGLAIGKPAGIFLATWLAVRSRIFALPDGMSWRHLLGVSFLGGIGFTMSVFIISLAFGAGHGGGQGVGHAAASAEMIGQAYAHHGGSALEASAGKLGVIIGSALAGLLGFACLSFKKKHTQSGDAPTRQDRGRVGIEYRDRAARRDIATLNSSSEAVS